MIDLIVADVDKEIQTMELEEKDGQKVGWQAMEAFCQIDACFFVV